MLACALLGLLPATALAKEPEPARLRVSGFGLLGNRQLRKTIRQIQPDKASPVTYDANFVEDAALVLLNRLTGDGYLNAAVNANLVLQDRRRVSFEFRPDQALLLPRPLVAREVHFRVRKGVLFHYGHLRITGLETLPLDEARGYFYKTDFLLPLKTQARFSPERLESSLANLQAALRNLGYRSASVTATRTHLDRTTGSAAVQVTVQQGPFYRVDTLKVVVRPQPGHEPVRQDTRHPAEPYSPLWEQDLRQELAREEFQHGFPDAQVQLQLLEQKPLRDRVGVDLQADVVQGPLVQLGEVRFEGYQETRRSLLQRRARLGGPELNRIEVDEARERISRLGIFKQVEVRYEPEDGATRDVVFELKEGPKMDVNLLFGYGSYDLAFGGVELSQYNLFGIGHNHRLRAVQSFKSSVGSYTYTIPEVLARDLSVFASAEGLRREEVSFDREELILSIGARKSFPRAGNQVGLRYAFEFLDTRLAPEGVAENSPSEVAAFILDGQRERRDNPLLPRKGYRLFGSVEFADASFGGESEYQRVELLASWHHGLGGGRWLHLGVEHGFVFSPDPTRDLPFNKRFFPGGDASIRGYQRGEASPLNEDDDEIGAESVLEWSLELEQALTPIWSVIGFVDGVGITPSIHHYPFDEVLWAAGGGLRWNTVIGPVRLEYGYNLNPRPPDPVGTLLFSIGYPF